MLQALKEILRQMDTSVLFKFVRTISIAFALIAALVTGGMILPGPVLQDQATGQSSQMRRILILSSPIHTDIAIPVDDATRSQFGFLRNAGLDVDSADLRYLVFGWGGRAFYTETPTWADLKTIPVLKSLTLDRSVMHVEFAGEIRQDNPAVTVVNIDQDGVDRLMRFIVRSFTDGPDGPVVLPGYAYGTYDAFFEANGYFNALAGCNTWTAAALRQAGASTGWWTPLPWMLRLSLLIHNNTDVVER
jgi:uncharacterized protein (TIGR02117 family)